MGVEASARHEGDPPQLRQAERPPVEDRRLGAGPGECSLPVRPVRAIYDSMPGPCPPTPRVEAFARSAWEWCRRRHLNRWTSGQRRKFEEIWYEEVTAAARARQDRP